jgi:hypothetical protein
MSKMNINEKNMAVVMLNQALLGAISPNFRMVTILFSEVKWTVFFCLEKDNLKDREEIEDIIGDFDGFLLDIDSPPSNLEVKIEVSSEYLPKFDDDNSRVVFRRKEV